MATSKMGTGKMPSLKYAARLGVLTIHFFKCCVLAGSAVAFGKLHGLLGSKALSLPGKNVANIAMATGSLASAAVLFTTGDPALGLAALCSTTALGGVMGAHMTASIGGALISVLAMIRYVTQVKTLKQVSARSVSPVRLGGTVSNQPHHCPSLAVCCLQSFWFTDEAPKR